MVVLRFLCTCCAAHCTLKTSVRTFNREINRPGQGGAALKQIRRHPRSGPAAHGVADKNIIVGFDTADDAGVYRVTADLAIVQTVDFFTPVVDDPYTFGAIAAANALSDVYAMGGRPLTALSVLAWPASGDTDVLEQILKGGAEKIHEAGCVILGGHSVNDPEIKFGYSITGTVHPDQ